MVWYTCFALMRDVDVGGGESVVRVSNEAICRVTGLQSQLQGLVVVLHCLIARTCH